MGKLTGGDGRSRSPADIPGPRRLGKAVPQRQELPREQQRPRVYRRGPFGKDLRRVRRPDTLEQDLHRPEKRAAEERREKELHDRPCGHPRTGKDRDDAQGGQHIHAGPRRNRDAEVDTLRVRSGRGLHNRTGEGPVRGNRKNGKVRGDESRRKMLMEAIGKSRHTFDEVMNFIKG